VTRFIVLLRAINVGGRKAPMAELREACCEAGLADVESYIQSGNLVLSSDEAAEAIEAAVEAIIAQRFGFSSEAMARTTAQWSALADANPFPDAAAARPKHLHLGLAKRPIALEAIARIAERATLGERVALAGEALWIDFAGGVGESKLTPAVLDKAAGSTVTLRNWTTVLMLRAMAVAAAR
jgi:uncharacterized protein (DUF1697 family)